MYQASWSVACGSSKKSSKLTFEKTQQRTRIHQRLAKQTKVRKMVRNNFQEGVSNDKQF